MRFWGTPGGSRTGISRLPVFPAVGEKLRPPHDEFGAFPLQIHAPQPVIARPQPGDVAAHLAQQSPVLFGTVCLADSRRRH